jgi:hypothetical protein
MGEGWRIDSLGDWFVEESTESKMGEVRGKWGQDGSVEIQAKSELRDGEWKLFDELVYVVK